MDKASKALRRSGVKLRSLSSGHGDLQMVISQLGEVRTTFKSFALAQATAADDLLRWASGSSSGGGGQENRALEETFAHLAELSVLWSEVQKDFADQLKEYRTQYELILEGEKHVTDAKEVLSLREQREGKLRRDLKRASKKAPLEEVCMLKEKLGQAERSRDLAHLDVVERASENEAVKLVRVKEALLRLGAAYCELAHKCLVIFSAHGNIAAQLPDVHDRDLQSVKYTGAGSAMRCVQEAKDRVHSFRRCSTSPPKQLPPPQPHPSDPPPPYTPGPLCPPTAPSHPPIAHSPSLPEERGPPYTPPLAAPHSSSAPNLAEDIAPPPNPRPADTPHCSNTSTSSPDLPHPPLNPPYDPYYEWLPGRGGVVNGVIHPSIGRPIAGRDAGTRPHRQSIDATNGLGTSAVIYPILDNPPGHTIASPPPQGHPVPPPVSVRPRVGRNPFWDSEEEEEEEKKEEEEEAVTSLSGALKKTGIK